MRFVSTLEKSRDLLLLSPEIGPVAVLDAARSREEELRAKNSDEKSSSIARLGAARQLKLLLPLLPALEIEAELAVLEVAVDRPVGPQIHGLKIEHRNLFDRVAALPEDDERAIFFARLAAVQVALQAKQSPPPNPRTSSDLQGEPVSPVSDFAMPEFRASPDDTFELPKAGQRVFERYVLEACLGRGGMGEVWRAQDEKLKRVVALKFLKESMLQDEKAVRDLKEETIRCLKLTHENIVRAYDFLEAKDRVAISMEFVDGVNLTSHCGKFPGGCLEVTELAPLVAQLCASLTYAHEKVRIIHRDIKPLNLLLTGGGELKVADFGISQSLAESRTRLGEKIDSGVAGTLVYMSPQHLSGERRTVADDIYSVGATLYELLTGKPPFYEGDIMTQIRTKEPVSMKQRRTERGIHGAPIPPEWESAIFRCLSKTASVRPTASELAGLLKLGKGGVDEKSGRQPSGAAKSAPLGSSSARANKGTLAAVMSTDVVNFAELTRLDERGTIERLRADKARILDLCSDHGGEYANSGSDSLLLRFPSLVGAMECALQIQVEFGARSTRSPSALVHRIGVHTSDVFIQEDDDIFGDGVNRTARLQSYARPGWICISDAVHSMVEGKVGMHAESGGVAKIKNTTISVWHVRPPGGEPPAPPPKRRFRWWRVGVTILVSSLAVALWFFPKKQILIIVDPPVADAKVWVGPQSQLAVAADGRLVVRGLADGEHNWTVQAPGYAAVSGKMTVTSGRARVEAKLVAEKGSAEILARGGTVVTAISMRGESTLVGTVPPDGVLKAENAIVPGRYTVRMQHVDCVPVDLVGTEFTVGRTTKLAPSQHPLPAELRIFSTPSAAEVWINSKKIGSTPATVPDQPSEVDLAVEIRALGYPRAAQTVRLKPREIRTVNFAALVAKAAAIRPRTLVQGSPVELKGVSYLIDDRPVTLREGLADGVALGIHQMQAVHPDYESTAIAAIMPETGEATLDFDLRPKPAEVTLAVAVPGEYTVWVGEKLVQVAGGRLSLPSESAQTIEIRAQGYKPERRTLTLRANSRQSVSFAPVRITGPDEAAPWEISDLKMSFVWIASGDFRPQRGPLVKISRGYWIGKTEVTQAQWQAIMKNNPSGSRLPVGPVENVTWDDAMAYCRELTKSERAAGRLPVGMAYTLPTEAQWEYACRAGTDGDFAGDLDRIAVYQGNHKLSKAHPVAQKDPNAWGLHDMHGNVREWCLDWFGELPSGIAVDPPGPESGKMRVVRGGGWNSLASVLSSSKRSAENPKERTNDLGFRLVLVRAK